MVSQLGLTLEEQMAILLQDRIWVCPPARAGVVPDYLEQQYARECCAASLGEIEAPDAMVLSALFKAMFTDPVAEVRDQSLRSISRHVQRGKVEHLTACALFWVMARDVSPKVRCTALEKLWEIDQGWGEKLAHICLADPDWLVSETARGIVAVA